MSIITVTDRTEKLRADLTDSRSKLRGVEATILTIRREVFRLSQQLDKEASTKKLFPDEVVGTIARYRYGAFADDPGPRGELVTHRFDLLVTGEDNEGIYLHCSVTSAVWDKFVATAGSVMLDPEGKKILVRRDPDHGGRYIPIDLADNIGKKIASESSDVELSEKKKPLIVLGRNSTGSRVVLGGPEIFKGDKIEFYFGSPDTFYGGRVRLKGTAVCVDKRGVLQAQVDDRRGKRADGIVDPENLNTLFAVRKRQILSIKRG